MRWKRRLSRRKTERLKREALAAMAPHMSDARQNVVAWRDGYLRTKAALMLDAFDERLVSLEPPVPMTFADLLTVELNNLAERFTVDLEGDLAKLRSMLGSETMQVLHLLEIVSQVFDEATDQFQDVAIDMLSAGGEAANAEADRRGVPGLALA